MYFAAGLPSLSHQQDLPCLRVFGSNLSQQVCVDYTYCNQKYWHSPQTLVALKYNLTCQNTVHTIV